MREETLKEYCGRLQRVERYIEDNLNEKLTVARLAEVAHFSPYHFHRIFRAHFGVGVAHFIRMRRMQAARREILKGSSVTQVAFDCGYESHAAFCKAFKKAIGMTPTQYKEIDMQPNQIVQRKPFEVTYVRVIGDYHEMPEQAWESLIEYAKKHELLGPKTQYFGMAHDNPEEVATDRLRYDACISFEGEAPAEKGIERQVIEGGRYAEFTHEGAYDNIGGTYNRIFGEWFPSSGHELADRPSFCQYINPEMMQEPEKLITKIYIPIKE